jgi:hypothetical protein
VKLAGRAESGQWIKATTEYEKVMAKAATLGMRQIGKLAEKNGREAIVAGGFSSRFAKTLRAINKPPSGYVLNPAVYIHSTLDYADVFETGKTITGNPLLWLPFPNVPPGKSREHMTPREYIRNIGPLIKMITPKHGGLIMLGAVVEGPSTKPSRSRLRRTFLKKRFGEKTRRTHVVPMFFAVSRITIPKKFDTEAAIEAAMKGLADAYNEIIKPDEDRLSGN